MKAGLIGVEDLLPPLPPCPKCQARPSQPCRTPAFRPCAPHRERVAANLAEVARG